MHPHFFLAAPLIVSLFNLTLQAKDFPEGTLLNLKPILEEMMIAQTSNIEHRNEPILLHGQCSIFEYNLRSVNISILGTQSSSIVSNRAEDNQKPLSSELYSMLIVTNSTVGLSSLRLICHGDHSSVATIHQSSLSISNCEISPATSTFPFLSTWALADTSMVTIVDTQVSWKHATSLPLVGAMAHDDQYLVAELSKNSILGRDADQTRGTLSIIGSGLSSQNTALPLATGPLFDFGFVQNNVQQSLFATSVSLTTSTLTNVTSHRRFIGDDLRFPLASQKLISSSVSGCTNHLYGTGLLDMNFGSGVCCQNSSFSKCETDADPTEGPPTVYLQHITTHFNHKLFKTCTLFDTCTFRDIHADRGGAIDSDETTTSPQSPNAPSFAALPTVWAEASFTVHRRRVPCGGIQIAYCKLSTIADCVFLNLSTTTKHGGGLTLIESPGLVTVSSCLFQKCRTDHATGSGGAVYSVKSGFVFASLRFRENNAATLNQGHDLWIELTTANQGVSSITECDTDQETIFVKFFNATTITPDFVGAQNKLTVTSVSCVVSTDNRTAKVALKVDQPISGTVLMLVDNSNGYEMPNDDSPPPINRMISFEFSSTVTSTTIDVSFGEWEPLQYEANYSLVTFGWKESIVDTNAAVLATPNPPRIVQAICESGDSEFDAFISLKARTLATGSYKASIKGIPNFWMVVDFVSSGSGGNIFSTKLGLKLQGEHAILDFETTYEIDQVIRTSTNKALILDPPRLLFTTPNRPLLKSVGTIAFSDLKKDVLTIKLVGEKMIASPYTLTVTDGSNTSTVTAVFDADGVNREATAVVYSMDESKPAQLTFGKTYTITGITCSGGRELTLTPNLKIPVPTEPPRVEKVISATLLNGETLVELDFLGRVLPSPVSTVTIKGESSVASTNITRKSATSFTVRFKIAATASLDSLVYGETYFIESVKSYSTSLICNDIIVTVPSNVRVLEINTTFSNDVKTGMKFAFGVEVQCSSSDFACISTAPVRIGWETGLQYGTTHTFSRMQEIGDSSQLVSFIANSFTTDPKPTEPVFYVDESGGFSDFCGDYDEKCKTMDEVWRIVKGIGFVRPTLLIVNSTTLDSPIAVTQGMCVMVTSGSKFDPKLHVASNDLSGGELGMIVVDSAFLELKSVDVYILSVSPSFVLIHATNSEIEFRDGQLSGPATGMMMNEDNDSICSWSSGDLQLVNCDTDITSTHLFQLHQGAINMKNGSLEIRTLSFDSNCASSSSFPSSRRNIHCSDEGTITNGSLSGGDGSNGLPLWASMEGCVMKGDGAQPDSPLFVPQLDKEQSKSVVDAATKQFKVTIVGSRLIPCGLFLEVFESETESNVDGKTVEFELNHTSFEKEVNLVIKPEEIASLDHKYELRCRLKFGKNLRTTDWFKFSDAEEPKPKFSQTPLGKALFSWILPVVISVVLLLIILIIVLIVCRRRRQQKSYEQVEMTEEQENEEYMPKIGGLEDGMCETNNIVAVNQHKGETTNNASNVRVKSTGNVDLVEVFCINDIDQKDVVETKFLEGKETLYHRLHEAQNPKPIEAEKVQKEITEQLLRAMRKIPVAQVLQNLNPHWVVFGNNTEVHFKLVDDQKKTQSHDDRTNNQNGGDAQRWNPPEENAQKNGSEQKSTTNKEAGLVFRLGLLLWEIETGQVPYSEHDGLNAHRHIALGVGLKMDTIENEGLRELIEDCMQLDPKNRPTLQKVKDLLFKSFSPSASDNTLSQQNKKY
ncbi:hypothetical protein BLNAU_13369 [Blattamonas nauphoetae]|uniref:Protein kinase domain-containing protein n=1 Tax=Blattamonas nauphoetae TaxID=2049346 RepID=A0ABQ9XKA3_9EUKA|nr:hypothetical protein BLNAU_13369 [Blattamonas nauphoetae]